MHKLGIVIITISVAALVSFLLWSGGPSFNTTEEALFIRIDKILEAEEPSVFDIVRTFSLPENCGKTACFFEDSNTSSLSYSGGNLSPTSKGLVFELEDLGGECVRTDRLEKRFGSGTVKDSCSHGSCWYLDIQKEWGILAFGLEQPAAKCVSTFVINSLPHQRIAN